MHQQRARKKLFISCAVLALATTFSTGRFLSSCYGADGQTGASTGEILKEDVAYIGRTLWQDTHEVVTAPLRIGKIRELSIRHVLVAAVVAGTIGGLVAFDEDIRDEVQGVGNRDADVMQNIGSGVTLAAIPLLYGAGVWRDDEHWRHGAWTAAESVIVSFALAQLLKVSFGRERPDANEGAKDWFEGGTSFVSDVTAHTFAAAEALSATFDHRWWVTLPMYACGIAVGIGRLGQDRHWASDVVGSTVVGIGTARLLGFMHNRRKATNISVAPLMMSNGGVGLRLGVSF